MKIVASKTFPGTAEVDALTSACAWLTEQCKGGFSPMAIVAKGDKRRVVLSGPEGGAIVFVKA